MRPAADGYAVIDVETTGLLPGFHHRIAEIAIVQVDARGAVTDEWSTLVNPDRDLGPQYIHGIHAAEVRRAPRFADLAGEIVHRIRGRVLVAHNWRFDAMHLGAEFGRCGIEAPVTSSAGLCTMLMSGAALPAPHRSLIECCAMAGLPDRDWHTAREDALGAASLLEFLLTHYPSVVKTGPDQHALTEWAWPVLPRATAQPVHRTPVGQVEPHFLARLVDRLPRADDPETDAYYQLLDRALLDRIISASEADSLLDMAHELGLHHDDVLKLHENYLRALARAAWEDGVVTAEEHRDLGMVTTALGLRTDTLERVLAEERSTAPAETPAVPATTGGLILHAGDTVVLTGDMREEVAAQAAEAGLRVTKAVSRKTRVLAAADPDSLSRKGKTARDLGVPIVHASEFLRALDVLTDKAAGS